MDYKFDFENLDVYQKSLQYTKEVFSITLQFRREIQYSLGDQFRRASLSICNNIAEGSRKVGKSRRQYYEYALDSARECVPMIQLAFEFGDISTERFSHLRQQCIEICRMLFRLSASVKT